ncbi:hypothetical protein DVH24_014056 [Malus domestica]|uniref:Uncharacterized protein n=1 Tax=Malus domestica TaxID=3750 RepID=A0A498JD80_MALDO|nr:hypothetical protein DVH24_014056 [Malus domestica]
MEKPDDKLATMAFKQDLRTTAKPDYPMKTDRRRVNKDNHLLSPQQAAKEGRWDKQALLKRNILRNIKDKPFLRLPKKNLNEYCFSTKAKHIDDEDRRQAKKLTLNINYTNSILETLKDREMMEGVTRSPIPITLRWTLRRHLQIE